MIPTLNKPAPRGRLGAYLTAGIGAGCLAGRADAALHVTFYGMGSQNPGSIPPTPEGIAVGLSFYAGNYYAVDSSDAIAAFSTLGMNYFTSGTDLAGFNSFGYGQYLKETTVINGATLNSDQNYANISFNGNDGTYEAVAQFFFDGTGNGYLVAMARNDDNAPLSISAGKAAIDAVPEPSGLALLALGAGGLITRRRRGTK
ncbi:PEP-CTERM sorting domain-containing protein [Haloferula sargassicola]|uniref:Ice-binding protein C-terminal domain-containing protein n=1 Tax=Haloferula sargassicola TaxID=490096 RepID=A0ABP9USP8_9BACT